MTETKVPSLNFKELLTSSLAMYRANFKLLMLLSLFSFIAALLVTVCNYTFLIKLPQSIIFLICLIAILISIWIFIAITKVVVNKNSNQPVSFKEVISYGRKKFWRVLGVSFGYVLIIVLPMLFFILILSQMAMSQAMDQIFSGITSQLDPGGSSASSIASYSPMISIGLIGGFVVLCVVTIFFLAPTSAIIEAKETGSFSNSSSLISKRFWKVLWIILVFTAIFQVIPISIGVIGQIFKEKLGAMAGLSLEMVVNIYSLFIMPLTVIFTTLFYFKLKQLKAAETEAAT